MTAEQALTAQIEAMRAQVHAQRAGLAAFERQIDTILALVDVGPSACTHPADSRDNLGTMGQPDRWQCRDCGHLHDPYTEEPQ